MMQSTPCGIYALVALWMAPVPQYESGEGAASEKPVAVATPSSGTAIDAGPRAIAPPPKVQTDLPGSDAPTIKRTASDTPVLSLKGPSWGIRALLPLGAVLLLMVLIALLVRRFKSPGQGRASGPLRVLQRAYLSPKQSVALLRVGRRFVLVGVTADRISGLCEINDPEESAWLLAGADGRGEDASAFGRLLDDEAGAYERGPLEPAVRRGQDGAGLTETRRSLHSVLEQLRALQSSAGPRRETPAG